MPIIHVIIPCYNAEKYLEQAVYSVLDQPYKEIDIILVDDGSPGETPRICDALAEKEPRVRVIHKPNGGVSSARNVGINAVLERCGDDQTGHYIAFLDADDVWVEDFFHDQVLELLSRGIDMIGFQSLICSESLDPAGKAQDLASGLHQGGCQALELYQGTFAAIFYSCKLFSRFRIRFDEALRYTEDKIFALECQYVADSIWLENRVLYLYRRQASSAIGRRAYGVKYFEPIIDGYLRMDREMACWNTPERGELRKGREMASIYHMDMVNEHIQNWLPIQDVDDYFRRHPEHIDLLLAKAPYDWIFVNGAYRSYCEHPHLYILKHRLLGVAFFLRRKAVSVIRRFL